MLNCFTAGTYDWIPAILQWMAERVLLFP
jgi:hypothetical protein